MLKMCIDQFDKAPELANGVMIYLFKVLIKDAIYFRVWSEKLGLKSVVRPVIGIKNKTIGFGHWDAENGCEIEMKNVPYDIYKSFYTKDRFTDDDDSIVWKSAEPMYFYTNLYVDSDFFDIDINKLKYYVNHPDFDYATLEDDAFIEDVFVLKPNIAEIYKSKRSVFGGFAKEDDYHGFAEQEYDDEVSQNLLSYQKKFYETYKQLEEESW
jgi:hypothetical protein